ncbi:hypothetical protein [Mesomycoplasma ovipneumoniae]|uniref:hypothetical protein n=1 Tax=Mesomycoplasma ovipneumoniae TaxID=29562 RepID=UPI00307FF158
MPSASIVELEIKNLSKEDKEFVYDVYLKDHTDIKSELKLSQDWHTGLVPVDFEPVLSSQDWEKTGNLEALEKALELSQDWEKTGNLEALDKALEVYFDRRYDMFRHFIESYENSLYNQCGRKWWYWKPRLLRRYIKFRSTSTYIKFKKLSSSRGWEIFWKVFNIITFPIQILLGIIWAFLYFFVAPIILQFLKYGLPLLIVATIAGIILHFTLPHTPGLPRL